MGLFTKKNLSEDEQFVINTANKKNISLAIPQLSVLQQSKTPIPIDKNSITIAEGKVNHIFQANFTVPLEEYLEDEKNGGKQIKLMIKESKK